MAKLLVALALSLSPCSPAAAQMSVFSPPPTPGNPCNSGNGGVFPDVAVYQGRVWCAVEATSQLHIVELNDDLSVAREFTRPLPPGLAFPRLGVHDGLLWLAYRDDSTAMLLNVSAVATGNATTAPQVLGPAGGNDPVAVGGPYVAWQSAQGFTINRRLLSGGAITTLGPGRPTGLSRLLPDGSVTLIDDDRTAVPFGTRPCWAGDFVVVEGPDGGNIVERNGQRALLWPGAIAFTPKCAAGVGSSGEIRVVTNWGKGQVRLFVSKDFSSAQSPELAWIYPLEGAGVQALPERATLTGYLDRPAEAARVEIWANAQGIEKLRKLGDATITGQVWSYEFDGGSYRGKTINLRARLVRRNGSSDSWSLAASIGGIGAGLAGGHAPVIGGGSSPSPMSGAGPGAVGGQGAAPAGTPGAGRGGGSSAGSGSALGPRPGGLSVSPGALTHGSSEDGPSGTNVPESEPPADDPEMK